MHMHMHMHVHTELFFEACGGGKALEDDELLEINPTCACMCISHVL